MQNMQLFYVYSIEKKINSQESRSVYYYTERYLAVN